MANLVERLGWTLVHFVWEGALVALLLAMAMWLAKRDSARTRYTAACFAMAVLAAAPALTFWLLGPDAALPLLQGDNSGGSAWTDGKAFLYRENAFGDLLPWLVRFWLVGVLILSLRLAGTLLHLERWRRHHTRPPDEAWQARVDALASRLGIRRAVQLLVSDRINVPSAWGVLKTVVVLPASLVIHLPPAQVETILLHELAHVRRHDYLLNLLQAVVETVLFYHPAVWWVSAVVRREREHCCDDMVVAHSDPMPYARALLHLEERRLILPRPTLSAKESNLMNRIARILSPKPAPPRVSPLATTLAALGILGAILGGTLEAQAQSAKATKPKVIVRMKAPSVVFRMPVRPAKLAIKPQPTKKVSPPKLVRPVSAITIAPNPSLSILRQGTAPIATRPIAVTGIASTVTSPVKAAPSVVVAQGDRKVPVLGDLPYIGRLFTTRADQASGQAATASSAPAVTGTTKGPGFAGQGSGLSGKRAIAGQFGAGGFTAKGRTGGFDGNTTGQFRAGSVGGTKFGGTPAVGFGSEGVARATGGEGVVRATGGENGLTIDFDRSMDTVNADLDHAPLSTVLRSLARKMKSSIVIEAGNYGDVTMVLTDIPVQAALATICRAGKATFRREGNIWYVQPKDPVVRGD